MKKWSVIAVLLLTTVFAVVFLTGGKASGGSIPEIQENSDNTVSVRFVSSPDEVEIVNYNRGESLSAPPLPESVGFNGWYVSGDKTMRIVDLDKLTVYESITLMASFD